jgi:hypothetical protein
MWANNTLALSMRQQTRWVVSPAPRICTSSGDQGTIHVEQVFEMHLNAVPAPGSLACDTGQASVVIDGVMQSPA